MMRVLYTSESRSLRVANDSFCRKRHEFKFHIAVEMQLP